MKVGYGKGRWWRVAGAALSAVLAFALMGTVSLAFAEEDEAEQEEAFQEGAAGDSDVEDDETTGSAFKLGDVRLSVTALDEDGAALAMGVPVERTYLVTNEGERAYVRFSSALAYGDLVQPSRLGVQDESLQDPDETLDESSTDDTAEVAASSSVWYRGDGDWWYRNEPLEPGERIVIHVVIEIPKDEVWREALSTGSPSTIEEAVHVEAVQARNMKVNADAEHPWGDLEVEVLDNDDPEGFDQEEERGEEI